MITLNIWHVVVVALGSLLVGGVGLLFWRQHQKLAKLERVTKRGFADIAKEIDGPQFRQSFGSSPLGNPQFDLLAQSAMDSQRSGDAYAQLVAADPHKRRLTMFNEDLRRASKPTMCVNCAHWDFEEGQASIKAHPIFMQVAHSVSPNRQMMRYEDGDPVDDSEFQVPAKFDTYEAFGACELKKQILHGLDTCSHFIPRMPQVTA